MAAKRKAPVTLATPVAKSGAKISNRSIIDETRASISGPEAMSNSLADVIEISSDPNSDEDISDAEEPAKGENEAAEVDKFGEQTLVVANGKERKTSGDADADSDEEAGAPSFGELLRGNEAIDVSALLRKGSTDIVAQPARTAIVPPSHQSLTTVLSQALRTDDVDLLESCLHTTDLATIRNTIKNIDSSLAGTLLQKLATRLHRRPGRAGLLMTWIQWTMIAHGGALSARPQVLEGLNGLHMVLLNRGKGLSALLPLKGKLDMMEAQMELRKKSSRANITEAEDDDKDLIWVEGEDKASSINGLPDRWNNDDEGDVPITNGYVGDSDDEEEDDDVLVDHSDAAEESLDEDDVVHEDVDDSMGEGEDEESDAEAAPPSKLQKTGSFGKRR